MITFISSNFLDWFFSALQKDIFKKRLAEKIIEHMINVRINVRCGFEDLSEELKHMGLNFFENNLKKNL
jgi:hypothetical protein